MEWGSSPRVRGKLATTIINALKPGLIPACAGKTLKRRCMTWPLSGSSPRVRGKLLILAPKPKTPRLIPACAGKTFFGEAFEEEFGAHPRVCGENVGNESIP